MKLWVFYGLFFDLGRVQLVRVVALKCVYYVVSRRVFLGTDRNHEEQMLEGGVGISHLSSCYCAAVCTRPLLGFCFSCLEACRV